MLFEDTDEVLSVGNDHLQVGIIYEQKIRQYNGFRELSGQVVQRESPQRTSIETRCAVRSSGLGAAGAGFPRHPTRFIG